MTTVAEMTDGVNALNSMTGFSRLWKFKTGHEVDDLFHFYAFRGQFRWESKLELVKDALRAIVIYSPRSGVSGLVNNNNPDTLLFYYTAFKHGHLLQSFQEVCILMMHLREILIKRQEYDFSLWFQFYAWVLLGFRYSPSNGSEIDPTASRPLTIREFRKGVPYEEVSDKGTSDARFVFVSHRWLDTEHPDPDGDQKEIILNRWTRAQQFLDLILNPLSMPDLAESDFIVTQGDIANSIFDDELSWAIYFFGHQQKHILMWYDYYSIPQGKDPVSSEIRGCCLAEIGRACQVSPVFALSSTDYFLRGWCFFECIQNIMGPGMLLFCEDGVASYENLVLTECIKAVYGKFCATVEKQHHQTQAAPSNILASLGLKCTNGSDLEYLSSLLENQSTQQKGTGSTSGLHTPPF